MAYDWSSAQGAAATSHMEPVAATAVGSASGSGDLWVRHDSRQHQSWAANKKRSKNQHTANKNIGRPANHKLIKALEACQCFQEFDYASWLLENWNWASYSDLQQERKKPEKQVCEPQVQLTLLFDITPYFHPLQTHSGAFPPSPRGCKIGCKNVCS